jgi:lambda family phage portal protein
MPQPNKRKRPTPTARLRDARARLELMETRSRMAALRDADRARRAMLATYAAADRGRRNRDWNARPVSADLAIIPDAATLNARARQMERDSWVVESAVGAYSRNVVGCGVIPIPQAKDPSGRLLTDLNRTAMVDFWAWAGDKQWCDVEGDQTHCQQQEMAERERVVVGEAFWVWSYRPNRLSNGRIDLSKPIGFKVQAFEPEQLDETVQSYADPATGEVREVRGGIEVDEFNRAVAYHVFTRNPNDYLWRQQLKSVRIDAGRVLHYYRKKRVRQKRGVTQLASVLQDARDLTRHKEANLWRAIMEACIGATVEREATAPAGGQVPGIMPRAAGDGGTTPGGMPTVDFVPGMIADPGPGVKLNPYIPQAPGSQYQPFQIQTLRGIAAGAGLGYGQLSRDFTQGTYSGQRQEMLEDRKVFEPLQELLAHNLLFPVYRIWFALSVAEGRLDAPGFELDPMRYTACDYVAPPPTWIDPKAEAEALEKLVQLRVVTREEIAHLRGTRLTDVLDKIAAEAREAGERGIAFAENNNQIPQAAAGKPRLSPDQFEQQANAYGVAVRAGAISPNVEDEKYFREQAGLPPLSAAVEAAWRQQPIRQPITIQQTEEPPIPVAGEPDDAGGDSADPTGELAKAIGKQADALAAAVAKPARAVPLAQTADAPNYRMAAADAPVNCAACKFHVAGRCEAYAFTAAPDHVCDAFETAPATGEAEGRRSAQAPGVPDGERPIDDPRGSFLDRGERGVQ